MPERRHQGRRAAALAPSAPEGASTEPLYGLSVLTGIGCTMSFFIGALGFGDGGYDAGVRMGVLAGSLLSAVISYAILSRAGAC